MSSPISLLKSSNESASLVSGSEPLPSGQLVNKIVSPGSNSFSETQTFQVVQSLLAQKHRRSTEN